MDIKDLMVGDWANYSILNINCKVVSIIGNHTITIQFVDKNNKVGVIHGLLEETINPIPLTEDILVKNGFERSERWHNCTMRTSDDFRICVQFKCGGSVDYITIMKHFNDLINRDVDVALSIHYVHQLQRLLRLCGIEKEFEL